MKKVVMVWRLILVFIPARALRYLLPGREIYRGTEMDTKARALGRLADLIRPPDILPTIEESRASLLTSVQKFDLPAPELARIEDMTVHGAAGDLPARIYCAKKASGGLLPTLVYLHGGGFVQGGIETHHALCAKLALLSGGMVISVGYRLAPEHPFPAGLDDAKAAFRDICARASELGIDPARTGLGGDSAGATFAAVAAQALRKDQRARPAFQVLIYPLTDGHLRTDSARELEAAYILPHKRLVWYRDTYMGTFSDLSDPRLSPLLASDLADLPPCLILTAGFDPLSDDGHLYAEKLSAAGNKVTHWHYPAQIHGFLNLTGVIGEGSEAIARVANWIKARR
ncbi:MAG: alpha/beta hydrolase [Paracoccaceae bacterium]